MADSIFSLMPVRGAELAAGKPTPYAIYDRNGKLLLAAGRMIESRRQLDDLVQHGFMHDPKWDVDLSGRSISAQSPMQSRRRTVAPPAPEERSESEASRDVVVAMDAVRWTVGETLYLQQVDSPSIRHTVRLIGFVKGQTVLVTAPVTEGRVILVRDGQSFVARAFSGRMAYAFAASAVKSMHSPHPYLHLSYPKDVRCTQVRRAARAEVSITAAISLRIGAPVAGATLVDLSLGGAAVMAMGVLGRKGDEGEVKFRLNIAGEDEYLNLRAILRSVAADEQGKGYRHGFEFVDVPSHAQLILSAFVHRILAEAQF